MYTVVFYVNSIYFFIYILPRLEWLTGFLTQHVRAHVWHFVLDDCQGLVSEHIAHLLSADTDVIGPLTFQWEYEQLQLNGSHLSYEYFGTVKVSFFHILCYGILLVIMSLYQVREMKRSGQIHKMVQLLNICVLAQLSSTLFHLGHVLIFSNNGYGAPMLDGIAETLAVLSQILMSSMMICIALGYTLNISSATDKMRYTGLPVVIGTALVHVLLVSFDVSCLVLF